MLTSFLLNSIETSPHPRELLLPALCPLSHHIYVTQHILAGSGPCDPSLSWLWIEKLALRLPWWCIQMQQLVAHSNCYLFSCCSIAVGRNTLIIIGSRLWDKHCPKHLSIIQPDQASSPREEESQNKSCAHPSWSGCSWVMSGHRTIKWTNGTRGNQRLLCSPLYRYPSPAWHHGCSCCTRRADSVPNRQTSSCFSQMPSMSWVELVLCGVTWTCVRIF